ncbi:MAG TPA: EamA family transporter [Steroidobacteraceae bacterium]|jgi:drug/metabolite transporter (DMT)-like permease|nr:EamA family transporter [Steroidobacteraceae bacterium]
MARINPGIAGALIAALLFGASTPLAKLLLHEISPLLLAGLLYAGSGVGLLLVLALRALRSGATANPLRLPGAADLVRWAGAILAGGVAAPVLLLLGLRQLGAAQAALLLNLESVLTALLAWFVFRENFDRRIAIGMAAIVLGGIVLSWAPAGTAGWSFGALLVACACLCWALDNNLTRKIATHDALMIACVKGLVAGLVNLTLAQLRGAHWPALSAASAALAIGFLGYGVSLTLFVVALRQLGAARTGAYFSLAPFFGAALAIPLQGEPVSTALLVAAALMAVGVWLHLTERHLHEHTHEPLEHEHSHRHDEHHQHEHAFVWDGREPHTHRHAHARLVHAHAHYPDIHHRHHH